MFTSIVSYGLAVGAVYALIGITYNVMFSASRVFSFTAGMLGMLGGVLGALFIAKWGLPDAVEFVDDLPHTATGKLDKLTLRKRFAAREEAVTFEVLYEGRASGRVNLPVDVELVTGVQSREDV